MIVNIPLNACAPPHFLYAFHVPAPKTFSIQIKAILDLWWKHAIVANMRCHKFLTISNLSFHTDMLP